MNYDNAKNILKAEIYKLVSYSNEKQEEVTQLLKEIEEMKLIAQELEESIKKLSE
jgi:hypothetical protein